MPSYAIVRKRPASSLIMASPYAKRFKAAYSLGAYAYANRAKIRYAARKIGRAYRKYKGRSRKRMFSRTNVGERVGTGGAKRNFVVRDTVVNSLATRTLLIADLNEIPEGNVLQSRERKIVNCRGYKLCMELRNQAQGPLYVNVAVLSPKNGNTGVGTSDFFRWSANDVRSIDFGDVTLTSNEYHCLPINSDKYTVLRHKRYVLGENGSTSFEDRNRANYANVDWWIPLKRQIRYETGAQESTQTGEVYCVMWCDNWGTAAGAGSTADQLAYTRRFVNYFREPKN